MNNEIHLNFLDSGSLSMVNIVEFHGHMMSVMFSIVIIVGYMLKTALKEFTVGFLKIKKHIFLNLQKAKKNAHAYILALELIWTITPAIILIFLATPTFLGLYSFEKGYGFKIDNTFKIIGNQWYWDYEYSDAFDNEEVIDKKVPVEFSPEYPSYMVATDDLKVGELRLLEADTSLYVPVEEVIRFIVTSSDVIHCFAVPALGIKLDGIPGRLNQLTCVIRREGKYYGQCSEICGVDHGFMPINLIGY